MLERHDLQLQINSTIYQGWESVRVRRSLDYFADSFDLTLTDNQAGTARTIKLGSPCTIRLGDDTVLTGYIDRIRPGYNKDSRRLTVSGRAKTADLVDCSLLPQDAGAGQRQKQTLLQLAEKICGRFGIKAKSTVSGCQPIQITALTPEQTPYEFLELHARAAGVRLVTDPAGNLVITRASKDRVNTALVLGENIEAGSGEFSGRDRFSIYYFTGQQAGSDTTSGAHAAHISGQATDINIRYRPTSIIAEGSLDGLGMAKLRAEWQRNVQYGRSRQAVYTVNGWRHKDGLWQPNTSVLVKDDWLGFTGKTGKGEWLMIGTVEYLYDKRGKRTKLTVMPAEAYDLVPLPAADQGEF